MSVSPNEAVAAATQRLDACYAGPECDWDRFFRPRREMANFATRYHLVYPALAYFITLKERSELADTVRPKLDTMYRGLLDERVWSYWHRELDETTWPLQERNLTYAGRLATFVGLYIDAFGEPPVDTIDLEGRSTTYRGLSESLYRQMTESPSCGVSCYHHQSMVMCNAHMLINNVLHDRLLARPMPRQTRPGCERSMIIWRGASPTVRCSITVRNPMKLHRKRRRNPSGQIYGRCSS